MKLSDFDYKLPDELVAQYPTKERGASRMMILDRSTEAISEKKFSDLAGYLNKGDTIVLNDARVIPARLLGKKETGANVEVFLAEKIADDTYKVLSKPSKRLKIGCKILFDKGASATVLENSDSCKIVRFQCGPGEDIALKLLSIGLLPLPPYVKRKPEKLDEERYQTVYAKTNGATAAPTAGLHFTDKMLAEIKDKGVNISYVTLDVSYGTFAPVLEEDIEKHKMHKEYFKLPEETARAVNDAKTSGHKVIAVGTTATRVLETCAENGEVVPGEGWTDCFIYPGYKFKIVDALLTNFHVPKSTLLMLVSAFAGKEFIFEAYEKAIDAKFRFFSYGDCMLIV